MIWDSMGSQCSVPHVIAQPTAAAKAPVIPPRYYLNGNRERNLRQHLHIGQVRSLSVHDLYDLCISGQTDPWSILSSIYDLWRIDHVAG